MSDLTGAQRRILEYCGIDGRWIALKELDLELRPDDIVAVPSLVEDGLIEHQVRARAVRITPGGRALVWTGRGAGLPPTAG